MAIGPLWTVRELLCLVATLSQGIELMKTVMRWTCRHWSGHASGQGVCLPYQIAPFREGGSRGGKYVYGRGLSGF